jgi:hypothetical protein
MRSPPKSGDDPGGIAAAGQVGRCFAPRPFATAADVEHSSGDAPLPALIPIKTRVPAAPDSRETFV